ncbi:hypothetical protein RclHR1_21510003 [Rhizophagus clarus]|uniref:Uncharacterized protein n=1 Tax=Rhizophagus clarus TaxID=94130 RepID=A0A2Z6QTL0_9GLOM|nr:hypothetical protein RclHR1_21510003 [Rhizophagus clarus]
MLSPVFMRKEQKCELAPISKNYKKTLHNEVVHILNNINLSLQFDVSKTYSNQKKAMNKKLLPAMWKLKQEGRAEEHIRRQHINSKREQIKQILSQAEEIGISIRTGLSRKYYRLDDIIDNKIEDDDDENDNDELNNSNNNVSGGNNNGNVGGDNNDDNNIGGDNNENDVGGGNKDNKNDVGGGNKDNDNDINIKKNDNGNNNDIVNAKKNSLDGPFYLFVPDSIKKGSTTSISSNTSKYSSKTRKCSIFSYH